MTGRFSIRCCDWTSPAATSGSPAICRANVSAQLDGMEMQAGVSPRYDTAPERFGYLITSLHERTGREVVVLVDEYDKPILDALEQREIARANRDYLGGLYGTIKASDAHVRFAFLTGVSKFSKVNLFSQLNNLTDITLDPVYSSICGYTEGDLDTVFAPELEGLDREVRQSLNEHLLRHLVQDVERQTSNSMRLARLLERGDCAGLEGAVPGVLREHPVRVAHQQRHREVRGLLRERVLLVLSQRWGTRSRSRSRRWRSRAATGGWTWRCAPAGTSTCSSSRWSRCRRRDRRSRSFGNGTMQPDTGAGASPST